jgi:regulator of protease activity HflC (stomatin/prohibitin superfamily)
MAAFLIVLVLVVVLMVATLLASVKIVKADTTAVLERAGKFSRLLPPGLVIVVPFVDRVKAYVTSLPQRLDLPPRPLATHDGGWVTVPLTVHFTVTDPVRATYEISSPALALEQLVIAGLRQVVRELDTYPVLTGKAEVQRRLFAVLTDPAAQWGLRIDDLQAGEIDRAQPPGGAGA